MTMTGSADIAVLVDRLQPHLMDVKSSTARALDDLESARLGASVRLRDRRDRVRAATRARRRSMEQANERMIATVLASSTASAAEATLSQPEGRVDRLVARAERAEEYASAALRFAWGSIEEASFAVLEAIVARVDANEAAASSGNIRQGSQAGGCGHGAGATMHAQQQFAEAVERPA
jgi:hypothetical protein